MKDFNLRAFERYREEYGVAIWKGIELALYQEPFLGEDRYGNPCYYAGAIDRQGNEWDIKWEIMSRCDWKNPTYAKKFKGENKCE